jgi:hypothetical protein
LAPSATAPAASATGGNELGRLQLNGLRLVRDPAVLPWRGFAILEWLLDRNATSAADERGVELVNVSGM